MTLIGYFGGYGGNGVHAKLKLRETTMRMTLLVALLMWAGLSHAQVYEPTPAFAGQTKASPPARESRYRVEVVTDKLVGPWALAFLPNGQ